MRGAALYFQEQVQSLAPYAGLITTDLMSLSDFKALAGPACPPALVYFHENQLSYPLAPGERMDFQYGFTDITTGLAADRILFNSHSHREAFLAGLPAFIGRMPEFKPWWVTQVLRDKSAVLHPGCRLEKLGGPRDLPRLDPPLIVWNHRWEFDKGPEAFFGALASVADHGLDFRLALLGERFRRVPPAFYEARRRFSAHIVQDGYLADRKAYLQWLERGAIVVSTALQENFGFSVVEAVHRGCLPLLPNRLSYPEILPPAFQEDFLYRDSQDLAEKLCRLISCYPSYAGRRPELAAAMADFSWENRIGRFDAELEALAAKSARLRLCN
jgi:glycosyltransferase involved in cell wall biosynthesis